MDRFIDAIHLRHPIRHPTQTCTGQQPKTPRYHARLVANDIPKQVTRHHDPVQRPWVLDHQHRRAINQLVPQLQLRELLRHHLAHHLPPQPARRQHVRLVQTPHLHRGLLAQRQVPGQARDALDLGPGVGFGVVGGAVAVVLLARAEVDPAGEFADDGEVDAAADGFLQGRDGDEGGRGEGARPQVAEGGEGFAEGEEALLGADGAGAPFLWFGVLGSLVGWEIEGELTGPPIAPRMIASAFFAAVRASSVRGEPVASIEHLWIN